VYVPMTCKSVTSISSIATANKNCTTKQGSFRNGEPLPSTENSTVFVAFSPVPEDLKAIVDRMDAFVSVTATCKGEARLNPLAALHANDTSITVKQAFDPKFNKMSPNLEKFRFNECLPYFQPENEFAFGKQAMKVLPDPAPAPWTPPADLDFAF